MIVTFLVKLDVQDLTTLADESAHVQDALESAGFQVEGVQPWARPTLQGGNPLQQLPPMAEPPPPI